MSKVSIELTEKVVFELMEREFKSIDVEHLPFKKFSLEFPIGVFLTKEQVTEDIKAKALEKGAEHLSKEQEDNLDKLIDKYITSNIVISFVSDIHPKVTIKDSVDMILFQFEIPKIFPFPFILTNAFAKDGLMFGMKITSLIAHVLDYIQEPKKEIIVTTSKERKQGKSNKKKSKGGGKTYIYRKSYKVTDIETKLEKREYNRIRESWGVRGHWRQYKDSEGNVTKKVWIEEHTRGNKEPSSVNQEFKITRVDD